MGVYVRGMEMPKSCWRCTLSQLYEKPREMLVCKITHEEVLRYKIDSNCPLVPVPPHGRLIDADAVMLHIQDYIEEYDDLSDNGYHSEKWCAMKEAEMVINDAPTIIEAEGRET